MPSIFISGAATGIGRAVAERFLAEGWTVGAYDIAPVTWSSQVVSGHLDVTNADSWAAALADFSEHTGGSIDVVDNNAGVIAAGRLAQQTPTELQNIIEVNCLGVTLGAHAAHQYLCGGGQLVNMASASAIYGQPEIAAYSASKFYVAGLTEALDLEWRGDGIRVVDIWPLWAKTSLAEVEAGSVRKLGVKITPEQVADVVWMAVHPRGRWARGKLHYGVSKLDKALYFGRSISPDRVSRLLTRVLTG
ncbi:SDR family oxidoreductase [Corynebacterium alimapuense]|uniref:Short-chain dehydrogenase n=1 Tax=Corynebacterium alimapuense TaxID=1576874 RepID=A0A3M8K6A2_9CORY|nr:SDR family oxidoreductase [Corynebacterium alimapuense]RNE48275.1 short-chain dehydrogenase [Corynebacterium alimapuense]